MTSLFHLFTYVLLLFNFSAAPESKPSVAVPEKKIHPVEETEEYISWSAMRKLNWEDFRCEPKRNTDAVALTSTALGITYRMSNGELDYEITCSFSKIKSWGILKTPYILAHEQGHFDITEIFARKLHQELLDYKFSRRTYRQDVNNIYDRVVKAKEAFQKAYDGQTDHSRNKTVQKEWEERIAKVLDETIPFEEYP
jgi:hypothetical protein